MIITSMNLHEFSQTHNREMGVLIKREEKEDQELFNNAKNEANLIIEGSVLKNNLLNPKKEPEISLDAEEDKLFKRLKSFRFLISEKEKVPAYMVFHDTDLKNIAKLRPKTKEELLNIKGIAIKKYEKYGEEILKIVNEFYNKRI